MIFFIFLKKKDAFWKIHPENPFGHSFGTAFAGLFILISHCYPLPHPCHNLPVSEGLIHIGCYFILVSLLTLLWLWESYLMLSNFLNLSYLLLHNKLPPHLVTKRTNINYLTVFAGQESDHSLAGFPMSAVARAVISSEGSTRGRFTSRFTLWLLEGFVSSQAVGMSISVPHWW